MNKYVLGFIHPQTKQLIYLANTANVEQICYETNPQLPGTANMLNARLYNSIDAAKSDLYLLRYHHREFLSIIAFVAILKELGKNSLDKIIYYELNELTEH